MVPAAVVVVLIAVTSGGGSKQPALPRLVSSYKQQSVGISLRLPKGWTTANVHGVLRLRSPDSTAVIGLAAFPNPKQTAALLLSTLHTVLRNYSNTTVKLGEGHKLAGLDARSLVVYGQKRRGGHIRVLLVGARGRNHAYVLDVYTGNDTPARRLVEAQEIILSMRLTG
jgi:hypothetical protein